MPKKQMLIRDIPEALYEWIESEWYAKRESQKEFLLKMLESASSYGSGTPQPKLFDFRQSIGGV